MIQETTGYQIRKTKNERDTNSLKPILIGCFSFVLVALSLFHVFFKPYSQEYLDHKKTYKDIINKSDNGTLELLTKYNDLIKQKYQGDTIAVFSEKLLNDYKNHHQYSINRIEEYNKKKKELALSHSFLGRNSLRYWLANFGIAIALLFFSIRSLYQDIVHGSKYRFHLVSFSGVIVGMFWIIHFIFMTQRDFNTNKYLLVIVLCAVLSAAFTYYLVKYYSYKDDIILRQLSLIERIKTIHYPKILVRLKYIEKYGDKVKDKETIEDSVRLFQKDINTTLNI